MTKPGPKWIDWSSVDLGKRPDAEIARELGLSRSTVIAARTKRGIPACPGRVAWDKVGLGQRPDAAIAAELGVPRVYVATARSRRKIPPYRAPVAPPPPPPPPAPKPRAVTLAQHAEAVQDRAARTVRWARGPLDEAEVARRSGVSLHAVGAALRGAAERGLVRRGPRGWEAA